MIEGGEVQLVFGHQVRLPKTIHILDGGRIKRIRGVAYATGVAGANNARMIEAARGVLNEFAPDTYIYSDVSSAPLISVLSILLPPAGRFHGRFFLLPLPPVHPFDCLGQILSHGPFLQSSLRYSLFPPFDIR